MSIKTKAALIDDIVKANAICQNKDGSYFFKKVDVLAPYLIIPIYRGVADQEYHIQKVRYEIVKVKNDVGYYYEVELEW
jgi:hypothetical protein